jgi:hypothetical protein
MCPYGVSLGGLRPRLRAWQHAIPPSMELAKKALAMDDASLYSRISQKRDNALRKAG